MMSGIKYCGLDQREEIKFFHLNPDKKHIKILILTLLFTSLSSIASERLNDSCAVGIQYGSTKYWPCDNGVFRADLGKAPVS